MTVSHSRVNFSHLPGPGAKKSYLAESTPIPLSLFFLPFFGPWLLVNSSQRRGGYMGGQKYWTEVHILVVDSAVNHDPPPWNVILQIVSSKVESVVYTFPIDSLWPNLKDAEILHIGACHSLQVLAILWPPSCEWAWASLLENEVYVLGLS